MKIKFKHLATALAILNSPFSILNSSAALTVPRTSEATIHASPLARGEIAYIAEDGAATAYIGSDTGPLRVSDPSTLRGSRLVPVPADRFTVVPDTNWVTAASNGWTLATQGVTARLVVTSVDGADIAEVRYTVHAVQAGLMAADMSVQITYNGSTAILDCHITEYTASATIVDITPMRYAFGDRDVVNDLTSNRFELKDALGEFDFADLRRWTRDLYNGNRGEDWAAYNAKKRVNLAGNALRFDAGGHFLARMNASTNLSVEVEGFRAMEFTHGRDPTATGTLAVGDITVAADHSSVTLTYTAAIDGFDTSLLRVKESHDLNDGEWDFLDPARYTVTASTVTIAGDGSKAAFYRLWYNGVDSAAFEVVFRASVRLESALYLRGTDNVLYRITVNAGAITATAAE